VNETLYKVIEKEELLKIDDTNSEPIIDGMLYQEDYIMLAAEDKMGKTILAQQMACNLTTGKPFLGIFDIPNPVNVWYFATEGKTRDLKDRFIRMSHYIDINTSRLKLIPTSFRFNTEKGIECLKELLVKYSNELPKVIIVDAMYRAIKGSLKDDESVNQFNSTIGWLQMQCGCSAMTVHHMTKPTRTNEGKINERSDRDTYGSAFILAAVDHIFWIEKWDKDNKNKDEESKKDKFIRCDTQRGGNISSNIRIRLRQPDPLYFEVVSKHLEERHRVEELLKSNRCGMSVEDLEFKSRVLRSTIYIILKEMQNEKLVEKIDGSNKKIKIYRLF
jgi:RecA-family ATPase